MYWRTLRYTQIQLIVMISRGDYTKYCGVYRITAPDGREYVGRSKDVLLRWHSYHWENWQCSGPKLVESIKKWGIDMHNFELVEECCESDLNKREQYYIKLWQTDIKGLNSTNGVKVGTKRSDATKAALSNALKGRISPTKGKQLKGLRIRNTQTGEEWQSAAQCARSLGIYTQYARKWAKANKNNLTLM